MNLPSCVGKVVRVRWLDVVEDSSSSGDIATLDPERDKFAKQDTHGVLLGIRDGWAYVATTKPAQPSKDQTEDYSVITINLALIRRVDVVGRWERVSLKT